MGGGGIEPPLTAKFYLLIAPFISLYLPCCRGGARTRAGLYVATLSQPTFPLCQLSYTASMYNHYLFIYTFNIHRNVIAGFDFNRTALAHPYSLHRGHVPTESIVSKRFSLLPAYARALAAGTVTPCGALPLVRLFIVCGALAAMPFLSLRVFGFVALSVCCGGGIRTRAHPRLFASLCYARHKGVVLTYSICRVAPLIPAFSASCRLSGCHLSALSSQVPPTISISCSPAVSDVSAYIPCARAFSLCAY